MSKLQFKLIAALLAMSISLSAQSAFVGNGYNEYDDYSYYDGFMGDNFSLQGALEMFKVSNNIEDFEFRINDERNRVNNLDLNHDGRIDYIRVNSFEENRRNHILVLQAVMGRREVQDVAVIAIEKTGRRQATLQIIGDEYLYGPNVILEPGDVAYDQDFRGRGPNADVQVSRFFVNVWYWPSVRFLYGWGYRPYRSPYYWGYYPNAWNPWNPYAYNVYYDYCRPWRRPFWVFAPRVRIVYVNNFYRPRRVYSPVVRNRWNRYCDTTPDWRDRRRNRSQTRPEDRPNRGPRGNVRNERDGDRDRIRNTRGAYKGDIERPRTPTTVTDRGSRGEIVAKAPTRTKVDRSRTNFNEENVRRNDNPTYVKPERATRTDRETIRTNKSYDKPAKRDTRTFDKPSKSSRSYDKPSKRDSRSYDKPAKSSRSDRSSYSSKPSRSAKPKTSYKAPKASRKSSSSSYKAPKSSRKSSSSSFKSSKSSRASKAPSRSSSRSSSKSSSSARSKMRRGGE